MCSKVGCRVWHLCVNLTLVLRGFVSGDDPSKERKRASL